MPRRKPKKPNLSKEQELNLKEQLDGIILADEMLSGLTAPDIPPMRPQRTIDVDNIKNDVESEARAILDSLSKFYHDMESLPEDNYLKHFATYMSQMEKNYKELRKESEDIKKQSEIQFDKDGNLIDSPENMDALKVRGTKSLMENLQTLMKGGSKIKDAEIIEPEDELINPRTKDGGTADFIGGSDNDEDFEIEDEIFD